jgi:hypothetical protein
MGVLVAVAPSNRDATKLSTLIIAIIAHSRCLWCRARGTVLSVTVRDFASSVFAVQTLGWEGWSDRAIGAGLSDCPADALAHCVMFDRVQAVRVAALSNPNCPADAVNHAARKDESPLVRAAAARHHSCSPDVLFDAALGDSYFAVRGAALHNPGCPAMRVADALLSGDVPWQYQQQVKNWLLRFATVPTETRLLIGLLDL